MAPPNLVPEDEPLITRAIATGFRKGDGVTRLTISDTRSWLEDPDRSTTIIDHALHTDVCSEFLHASHAYAGDDQFEGS